MKLYLAGGVFNAGEQLHNLYLEKYLRTLGYEVILPQREALRFFDGQQFDLVGIAKSCRDYCHDPNNLYVGSTDGADADSGTCVEYGLAITARGQAVVYRTDFRTASEGAGEKFGVNIMLNIPGTAFVYHPCSLTELDEAEAYYKNLAEKIHQAIQSL